MNRRGLLIVVGAALAVILVWYFAVFSPMSNGLHDARTKKAAAQAQTQSLKAQLAQLQGLSNNQPSQQADLMRLSTAVPDTPNLGDFILSANQIATQSGISWLSISPQPPAAGTAGQPATISLAITINGGFFQMLDYLNRLQSLPRLVVVDTLSLNAGGGTGTAATGGSPTLTVSVNARMFTRAAVAGTGGTGAAGGTGSTDTTPTTAPAGGTTPSTTAGGGTPASNGTAVTPSGTAPSGGNS